MFRSLRLIPRAIVPVAAVSLLAQQERERQARCAGLLDGFFGPSIPSIKKDIISIIEKEDDKRDDGTSVAPTFIRLAWHASGTYSKPEGNGGSGGATMRYSPEKDWGANAGLSEARSLLNPLAAKHGLSIADIWTLAGATAVETMGGPDIKWRAGRKDSDKPTKVPDGRLPDADNGGKYKDIAHLRKIFHRMGFTDKEIVILSGAHAVGRCHENASGYWGPWTYAQATFSNEYFRLLIDEKWTVKKTHMGKRWTGPMQYESKDGQLMMLPTDMALLDEPEFKKWVEIYAKDQDLFFKDFAVTFGKLLELGVSF